MTTAEQWRGPTETEREILLALLAVLERTANTGDAFEAIDQIEDILILDKNITEGKIQNESSDDTHAVGFAWRMGIMPLAKKYLKEMPSRIRFLLALTWNIT